jgi:exonuclease SbcC
MIKLLELVNFRSHKHTILEFDQYTNFIIGRGQAGKSTIRRALKQLCFNRPLGDKCHSFWMKKEDETLIKAVTWEDQTIIWKKILGKSAEYELIYPDGEKEPFRKLKREVPDKISNILNIDQINFQNQFDNPFIISGTTGEISKAINKTTKLDISDDWLSELNSNKLKLSHEINQLTSQLDISTKKLKSYEGINGIEIALNRASQLSNTLETELNKKNDIGKILYHIQDIEIKTNKLNKSYSFIQRLIKKADNFKKSIDRQNKIKVLCFKTMNEQGYLTGCQIEKKRIEKEYSDLLVSLGRCPLCLNEIKGK